jgi:hypothetical protein
VTVDGAPYPGLRAEFAVGEQVTGSAGTWATYSVPLRPSPTSCDFEGTTDVYAEDQPNVWVEVKQDGTGGVVGVFFQSQSAEIEILARPRKAGDTLLFCVHRMTPVVAPEGPLMGKRVELRGRVEVRYCGMRREIQERLGPG